MNHRSLAVTVLVLGISASAAAQSPPRLDVYSDNFSGGASAPAGSAQRGTTIVVDVPALEQLEADTTALEARIQAHLADAGAHQPHGHPHTHCPPGTREASATPPPGGPLAGENEELAAADPNHSHCPMLALLDAAIGLLAPNAHAQSQPPPLQVYDPDMITPGATPPTSGRNVLSTTLPVDIPLIDQVRALIRQLDSAITTHVAARPGHAHSHPHSH